MGLLNFLGGDSSSSTKNETFDQRIGASEQGTATRIDAASNAVVNVSSDAVAQAAIDNAHQTLVDTTGFLDGQLSKLFETFDRRAASADANVAAAQELAAGTVAKSQEGEGDRVTSLILALGVMAIVGYAINQGYFK